MDGRRALTCRGNAYSSLPGYAVPLMKITCPGLPSHEDILAQAIADIYAVIIASANLRANVPKNPGVRFDLPFGQKPVFGFRFPISKAN